MNLPPTPFHSFLNCLKTPKYTMTFKFSDFQFVFINVLWKIKGNCMSRLFSIADLLVVGKKKF